MVNSAKLFLFFGGFKSYGADTKCKHLTFLLWSIDTKLGVWVSVAYFKRQLVFATKVFVIKVKVTVTKDRNSVSAQQLKFSLAI
jgi:hypothetical protein